MKIKVSYSKSQLEACVQFIAENNPSFIGKHDAVRQSLRHSIEHLIRDFPDSISSGTMGYMVSVADIVEEGIDSDQNEMYFEFAVDPAIGKRSYLNSDYHTEYISVEKKQQ